jgi:hypothetical protein
MIGWVYDYTKFIKFGKILMMILNDGTRSNFDLKDE